ncbi:MAG: Sua5/YciO/YrdC/YwlC family protein [Methanobrevibacter sp.]|jgi:L-threonylcarbamoyladenylate synthase|nr:Sua5/YciO/YrdC/YwlC family protein [Candidatus Methanoflexus mossambicus]
MDILNIDNDKLRISDKNKIKRSLESGNIIIYPTDTIYGLGVDITNETAIKNLYVSKNRSFNKAISVIFPNIEDISKYCYVNSRIKSILEKHLPGPFTFILELKDLATENNIGVNNENNDNEEINSKNIITKKSINDKNNNLSIKGKKFDGKNSISKLLTVNSNKIGIRIPNSQIAMEIAKIMPITSTSANISNASTYSTVNEIINQLNTNIDLAIDIGRLKSNIPSTVVDLTSNYPKVLRNGVGDFNF